MPISCHDYRKEGAFQEQTVDWGIPATSIADSMAVYALAQGSPRDPQ
jgi:hypothetical protein